MLEALRDDSSVDHATTARSDGKYRVGGGDVSRRGSDLNGSYLRWRREIRGWRGKRKKSKILNRTLCGAAGAGVYQPLLECCLTGSNAGYHSQKTLKNQRKKAREADRLF